MAKAKKDMTPAQKAAARVPDPVEVEDLADDPALRVKPTPKERGKRFLVLLLGIAALLLISMFSWLMNFTHETDAAKAALESTPQVQVVDESGWIAFGDESAKRGCILYPGAKIAAEAYAPLAHELAEEGVFCVIPKVPFHFALLDIGAAAGIMEAYPGVGSWYVGGHSLGGVAACQWVAANPDAAEGIVLLASYPDDDLRATDLRVLSIRGSNDQVMNAEAYEAAKGMMPADAAEVVIEGGNHAQFGDYGEQAGDGAPGITGQEQRDQTVDAIVNWMDAA